VAAGSAETRSSHAAGIRSLPVVSLVCAETAHLADDRIHPSATTSRTIELATEQAFVALGRDAWNHAD
jgi:hypothetical protein